MNVEFGVGKVVMNIGTGKFFLHQTAEELQKIGILDSVICGWLVPSERKVLRFILRGNKKTRQLIKRSENLSSRSEIGVAFFGELFWQTGVFLAKRRFSQKLGTRWILRSCRAFDRLACKQLIRARQRGATIYHFRSGFGGSSVNFAASLGMKTICDHSIVHPKFDFGDVSGNWDPKAGENSLNRTMLVDIEAADQVIVNSQFVAETFSACSFRGALVILTPPIDPSFTSGLLPRPWPDRNGVVFIGKCEYRKGIDIVAAVSEYLDPQVKLIVIGRWDPTMLSQRDILRKREQTKIMEYSSPEVIAQVLSQSLIFLYPTRAEGSARVVGIALHAECIVMTTRESGLALSNSNSYLIGQLTPLEIAKMINELTARPDFGGEKAMAGKAFILELEKEYLPSLFQVYELMGA